jgi:hypothetical protein
VLHYLTRLTLIVFGFVAAILAASLFLNALLIGSSEWAGGDATFYYLTIPAFAAAIGYSVFVPAAIIIVYAELTAWRDWLFYTIGGAAASVIIIVWKWRPQTEDVSTFAAILATGIIGGFVYWMISGRSAGLFDNPRAS